MRTFTHPDKKVDHKKYVECQIDLLSDVAVPGYALLNMFTRRVDEVDNQGSDWQYKNETHLKDKETAGQMWGLKSNSSLIQVLIVNPFTHQNFQDFQLHNKKFNQVEK